MAATKADVERWIAEGREMGATHVISVTDTFESDDYPVYVMPDEDVEAKRLKYGRNMQRVNEVIDLREPIEDGNVSYTLQRMTGNRAKQILTDLLVDLSHIDPDALTTFELNILHRCANNPPKHHRGIEEKLTDG